MNPLEPLPERIVKRRQCEKEARQVGTASIIIVAVFAGFLFVSGEPIKEWVLPLGIFYAFLNVTAWMRDVHDLLLLIAFGEDDAPSPSEIKEAKRKAKREEQWARHRQLIAEQQEAASRLKARLRSFLTKERA